MFFQVILILLLIFLILIFLLIMINDNDQDQRNAGTISKYAHFSTWKTSVNISITDQKNTTIFLEVEMYSCI